MLRTRPLAAGLLAVAACVPPAAAQRTGLPAEAAIEVTLPAGDVITATLTGSLDLVLLPPEALTDGSVRVPMEVRRLRLGGGGTALRDSAARRSTGEVRGDPDPDAPFPLESAPRLPAGSALDLFVEVRVRGSGTLTNRDPIELASIATSLPPMGEEYRLTGPAGLLDEAGLPAGTLTDLTLRLGPPGRDGGESFVPFPVVLAPDHSEELFGARDGAYGSGAVPVARGPLSLSAAEWELRPVIWTRFDLSADAGATWRRVARDGEDESLAPGNNPDPALEIYEGDVGFTAVLDTTDLPEGEYLLRAEMLAGGRRGAGYRLIRVMDAPPRIRIPEPPGPSSALPMTVPPGPGQEEPRLHGSEVSGTLPVAVDPPGLGPLVIDLYEGSEASHNQKGIGTLHQDDLGPFSRNPPPPGFFFLNMYCTPAATANALWRQAAKDPRILNATKANKSPWLAFLKDCIKKVQKKYPDDPKEEGDYGEEVAAFFAAKKDTNYVKNGKLTLEGLGMALACKMKVDPVDGTTAANVDAGLTDFFREQGIQADYTASSWSLKKDGNKGRAGEVRHPGKRKLLEEIGKDEMVVIVLKPFRGKGSHMVTGKGYKDDGKGHATITIVDPLDGSTIESPVGRSDLGNTGLKYKGKWWLVDAVLSRSPTDATRNRLGQAGFRRVGEDRTGLACDWDTRQIQDGFHTLRATVCVGEACGSDPARFYVNNHDPQPGVWLRAIGNSVELTLCEALGAEDVVEYAGSVGPLGFQGPGPGPDCAQETVGPLPNGLHPWQVVYRDYSGRTGVAMGQVQVP